LIDRGNCPTAEFTAETQRAEETKNNTESAEEAEGAEARLHGAGILIRC